MLLRLILLASLSLLMSLSIHAEDAVTDAERATLATDSNAFALELYGTLKKDSGDSNLFYSPYSLSTALAMTYGGARGTTAAQMEKVLHFSLGPERLPMASGALYRKLNGTDDKKDAKRGYQLNVANRLFVHNTYKVRPDFLAATQRAYGAGLEQLDFKDAEGTRQHINTWVEQQTNSKIKDLIPKDGTRGSVLVLTNAVYFKGDWAEPFKKDKTKDAAFHAPGKDVTVPLMNQTGEFFYAAADGVQALSLPYAGYDLSMVVLLPEKADGLPQLEAALTSANLQKWLSAQVEEKVDVTLPKFKLSWGTVDLVKPLQSMGLVEPTDPHANFSGMTDAPEGLFIGGIFHQAFVDVNEQGTEAAAATAITMKPGAVAQPRETQVFRADHPFVFLIRENKTGTILFLGRVTDPKAQ